MATLALAGARLLAGLAFADTSYGAVFGWRDPTLTVAADTREGAFEARPCAVHVTYGNRGRPRAQGLGLDFFVTPA